MSRPHAASRVAQTLLLGQSMVIRVRRIFARLVRWLASPPVPVVALATGRGRMLTLVDINRALDRLGPSALAPRTAAERRDRGSFAPPRPAIAPRPTWAPALVVVDHRGRLTPVGGIAPEPGVYGLALTVPVVDRSH